MFKQSRNGTRDMVGNYDEYEVEKMNKLNEVFGSAELTGEEERTIIWLAGWDESTVSNIVSAIHKAIAAAQRQPVEMSTKQR